MGVSLARGSAPKRFFSFLNVLVAVVVVAALLVGANLLLRRPLLRHRVDLSPGAIFTLSPETREQVIALLRKKEAEVAITAFFHPARGGAPGDPEKPLKDAQARIRHRVQQFTRELLELYDVDGGDHITVRIYNPLLEHQEAKERAQALEVSRRVVPEQDLLVLSLGDRKRLLTLRDFASVRTADTPVPGAQGALPILESYTGEQALSTAIRGICMTGKPKLRFLVGHDEAHPDRTGANGLSMLTATLREEGFDLGVLDLAREPKVPDDCEILAIIQPLKNLAKTDQEKIQKWILEGGRLFFAMGVHRSARVKLKDLVGPFGLVETFTGVATKDRPVCWGIPNPRAMGGLVFGHRMCRVVQATDLNPRHEITEPLRHYRRWPRFPDSLALRLDKKPPQGVTVVPLARTPNCAWESYLDPTTLEIVTTRPRAFLPGVFTLAAAGTYQVEEGGRQARAVVLGSSDAVINTALDNYPANKDLVINAFNWLADRTELVRVTAKPRRARRLRELDPGRESNLRLATLVLFPGLVVLAGLVVFFLRRR